MIFKDAHASLPVYMFDRNSLTMITGKITSFTPSYLDVKAPAGKLVVDITVLADGNTQVYTIDDSLSIAYFGNTAISLDKDHILSEIENVKSNSDQILSNIDFHKTVVEKCQKLLEENNPVLKERAETEARFAGIENKIDKLASMMEKFIT